MKMLTKVFTNLCMLGAIFTTEVEEKSSIEIGVGCNTFDINLISTSLGEASSMPMN